jgi:hypothetical protein
MENYDILHATSAPVSVDDPTAQDDLSSLFKLTLDAEQSFAKKGKL